MPRLALTAATALALLCLPATAQDDAFDPDAGLDALVAEADYWRCLELVNPGGIAPSRSGGQDARDDAPVLRRLILALDSSGSMASAAGNRTRMDVAREEALAALSQAPDGVEVGLIAFGHRGNNDEAGRQESCAGVDVLYPPGVVDPPVLAAAVEQARATGWTPLASAIEMAGNQFQPTQIEGEQVVWIISDGEETCGGDPVAAARALHESELRVVINIIGYALPAAERAALEAVAEAGGGIFIGTDPGTGDGSGALSEILAEQMDRLGEVVDVSTSAISAQMSNLVQANNATTAIRTCLTNRIVEERARMSDLLVEARLGDGVPGYTVAQLEAMRTRLEARITAARTMTESAITRFRRETDDANAVISDVRETFIETLD
ncbi:VWA domain-containing protein [Hasllibacter sp. MH4015]|uniref:vWA domain-containing protein n=1 Tax=Hasllibacter sp. MH4015 TaxID=2854029 RepID=UPI001CD5BBB2|nr:VWA domain-containing protein [Hasllibacter sp. MH4015]